MDKTSKEEIKDAVLEVIEDVVLPALETITKQMATKEEVKRLENRMAGVENRLDRVENRLDRVENKLDKVAEIQLEDRHKLSQHEKRLIKMERSPSPLA